MITNITLENFKCFRQVSINPKLLTVLIGPNGTGKSAVLQALLLLKQSVGEDHIVLNGDCINLSGPDDILPNFLQPSLPVHFGIGGTAAGAEFQYFDVFSPDPAASNGDEMPRYLDRAP